MHARTLNRADQRHASRQEAKERTRRALLDGALRLLEDQSFDSLSLREVTRRAAIVPTAFYRHFSSMEELGLALVDESVHTLRQALRAQRAQRTPAGDVIRRSIAELVRHVHEHPLHFRFITRERYGGSQVLRDGIRREIQLFAAELATDLARLPDLDRWATDDLHMVAGLIVNTMVTNAAALVEAPADRPWIEAEIITTAEKQLRLVTLGIPSWRSGPAKPQATIPA